MVALNKNIQHDDTTRRGGAAPQRSTNRIAQRITVSNGGLSGNIPNETTDYLWQGNQIMEERDPFGGTGSTDTPIKQYIWGTYIDECIQMTSYTIMGPQSLPAGVYYPLQDLLYRACPLNKYRAPNKAPLTS